MSLVAIQHLEVAQGLSRYFGLNPDQTTVISRAAEAFAEAPAEFEQLCKTCQTTLEVYTTISQLNSEYCQAQEVIKQRQTQVCTDLSAHQQQGQRLQQQIQEREQQYNTVNEGQANLIEDAARQCASNEQITFIGMKNPFSSTLARAAVAVGKHAGALSAALTLHTQRTFLHNECSQGVLSCADAITTGSVVYPIIAGSAIQYMSSGLSTRIRRMQQAQDTLTTLKTEQATAKQNYETTRDRDNTQLRASQEQEQACVTALQEAQSEEQTITAQRTQLSDALVEQCTDSIRAIVTAQLQILGSSQHPVVQRAVITTLCHAGMIGVGVHNLLETHRPLLEGAAMRRISQSAEARASA